MIFDPNPVTLQLTIHLHLLATLYQPVASTAGLILEVVLIK